MSRAQQRLLVPVDGSQASARVLGYLSPWLSSFDEVMLMHVVEEDPSPSMMIEDHGGGLFLNHDSLDGPAALEYLKRLCGELGKASEKTTCIARAGQPATEILDAIEREEVSLVAMATHGHGGVGRWALGSHTDKVIRASRVPVLVVPSALRSPTPLPRGVRHVLAPIDGSEGALRLVRPVAQLVENHQARVTLVHFIARRASSAAEEQAKEHLYRARCTFEDVGISPKTQLLRGAPGTGIVDFALPALDDDRPIDLIAMTTHGRTGLARLALGSVTEHVMRHTRLPMLIVRAHV